MDWERVEGLIYGVAFGVLLGLILFSSEQETDRRKAFYWAIVAADSFIQGVIFYLIPGIIVYVVLKQFRNF